MSSLEENQLCTEACSPANRLFIKADISVESTRKIFIFAGENNIYEIKVSESYWIQFYKWNHCQRHCMISTSKSYFGNAMQNTSTLPWPSAQTLYNSLYTLHHEVAQTGKRTSYSSHGLVFPHSPQEIPMSLDKSDTSVLSFSKFNKIFTRYLDPVKIIFDDENK